MGIHANEKVVNICDYFNLCNKSCFTFLIYSALAEM